MMCFIFVPVIETAAPYENLSREQLITTVKELTEQVQRYQQDFDKLSFEHQKFKHELDQLKKLVFGSRHERFTPSVAPEQLTLDIDGDVKQPEVITKTFTVTRTTVAPSKKTEHNGRMKLPAHLPRQVVVIEPTEDVSGYKEMGEEITEKLEFTPGKFFVRQYKRKKYAHPDPAEGQAGVVIGTLPARIIEKGMAGPGLLSQIIIDKYMDHLPLYRQIERFKREGIALPISTVSDWVGQVCRSAEFQLLTEAHRKMVLDSGYLEGDETTIKVLDKDKKARPNGSSGRGKTHLGYYWVYRAPLENMVLFDYRPGRGREGPKELLKDFQGYLQTDGYEVYEYFGDRPGITLVGCMAHARRKFTEALDNDRSRAEQALTFMQQLYAIERKAKEENLSHDHRLALRQKEAVPILKSLEEWFIEQARTVLPQSPIGKAVAYSLQRWEKLCLYTTEGKLLIDNNLVENSIRPVAIGRKNYLFAGSHNAAQRAASIYSLLGTCKINHINPHEWLRDVLEKLPTHPITKIHELLPHNWTPSTKITD